MLALTSELALNKYGKLICRVKPVITNTIVAHRISKTSDYKYNSSTLYKLV